MTDRRADQDPHAMGHRNHRIGMWVVLFLVLLSAVGVGWVRSHVKVQEQAPDFTLTSTGYENGTQGDPVPFSLSDYRGKTVLLDFMAVTCTSCRVLTDKVLRPTYAAHGDDPGFVLVSIDAWADPGSGPSFGAETEEALIALQQREQVPWRHALDTDEVYLKYSAISLPKIAIVDPNGALTYTATGVPSKETVLDAVDAAMSGEAQAISVFQPGLLGLAFVAGVASFFSPCSVGMVPAYMGLLLRTGDGRTVARTLRGGLATAAGIVSVYALLAVLFAVAGDWMRARIDALTLVMGALLVLFGALMLRGGAWDRIAVWMGMGKVDGRRGFFAFGVGYGLAAFGCTGPLMLPILALGFSRGPTTGLGVLTLYAIAVAGFMLLAAGLVASGHRSRLMRVLRHTRAVTFASAALMVLGGLILIAFALGWFTLPGLSFVGV